ncbi:hypothetical protein QBC43DRAFT_200445 [Cladorrhinum sp. PSN259]|nr:hypothetical protein QBC43DRAFT_200445 [Cladorrhinum sp. PSN259]
MAFGRSITDLLETYSNCISLLRAFRHRREGSETGGSQDKQVRLRKSLKSDRALVERAYSLKVSESGSRFRKGDARAISTVERILASLKGAITNLLRVSGRNQSPDLDYESLMSLSNSSRVKAIKAIDSLSRRLASPSRSSIASASSKASTKKPSGSSSRHKHRSRSDSKVTPLKAIEPSPSEPSPREPRRTSSRRKVPSTAAPSLTPSHKKAAPSKARSVSSPTLLLPPPPPPPIESSELQLSPQYHLPAHLRPQSTSPKPGAENRISMMSFASNSTKLGEIPQRKLRSVYLSTTETTSESDEYNVKPTFPLRPYTVEVKEKRFWGGLFGRKKESSP